ncbi:cytosolic 5'-nucleotidase 1A-like [Simochromis diagramma]|uniref:cytosolic 5'-nucleotidase 1A-like n=1 Tax=Simochromis diagramma TaxID=43689 RepID=UPI001A7EA8E7|nr:cytosolic 5'-nucleotidase 1A-like [Simochromis diagramma]
MSLNNGQSLNVGGQDFTKNGDNSSRAPWEDARTVLRPSTPTRKPKSPKPENAITIAVSSRVLFNMEKEQQIYEQQGMEEYIKYQVEHETEPFSPGPAFSFVKALEAVNAKLRELYPESEELFDVVLMTNNHANVGLRLINTINHHQLFIERFCMTGGNSPIGYLKAYHTNLYLSADPVKVREALAEGIAAAIMFTPEKMKEVSDTQLRVAFDGDAVLFSDESERICKAHGLDKFFEHEKAHENKPLDHGPLKGFLEVLGKLQKKFYGKDGPPPTTYNRWRMTRGALRHDMRFRKGSGWGKGRPSGPSCEKSSERTRRRGGPGGAPGGGCESGRQG